jgi:hypothetical protein
MAKLWVWGLDFIFCALRLIFRGTEVVGSRFNILRSRTRFWWYGGCRVSFSCFARPYSFSGVPRVTDPVFMFCTPRTRFRRYRGCQVPFSYFALPESFPTVPRASGLIFIFCAPGLVYRGTEDVGSRFHVLRSRTHFRRYWGHRVLFSCFALPDSFSTILRASGPVFMFCTSGLVFGGAECVGFCFHVLRGRTCFRRCRGRPVPFSYFSLSDSFSAVPRVTAPVFMFCTPGLVFGGTEGVGSRFYVLRERKAERKRMVGLTDAHSA